MEYTFLEILNAGVVACLLLCLLFTASWQMDPVKSGGYLQYNSTGVFIQYFRYEIKPHSVF